MFVWNKALRLGTLLFSVLSVTLASKAGPFGLNAGKAPGMLISPKGPRGWRFAYAFAPSTTAGQISFSASKQISSVTSPRLRAANMKNTKMALSGSHLVTFGDVWRDALEGQFEDSEGAQDIYDDADSQLRIVDVVKPFTTAASAFGTAAAEKATSVWNTLINEPTPEEVEANLAAFAKAHGGAVMTPLSEDELESEVKFCTLIPELRDALVDAEVMQDELEEAALQKELAAKVRSLKKSLNAEA
mmetsp:Transcript_27191/g.55451  ORF Transcript_27191/g.55451 Transcript_27191/m.55451 type:complete len:245 (-) Transcript_27191:183-917(-)|eukprot:CAMPEP_0181316078 /NCGR_PEP_ID=MMETSP1101-20121128/15705_1 /TAXON_ID=46948 /ORGANISM="Rhodomonas abbreviata, Strain Caron Lab Isolate" /LENGTH=244 /DNA_ID=CAMNT_0023423305 /DNA_START=93 /DNA_END=827 /DNA_ORIENTATION=+